MAPRGCFEFSNERGSLILRKQVWASPWALAKRRAESRCRFHEFIWTGEFGRRAVRGWKVRWSAPRHFMKLTCFTRQVRPSRWRETCETGYHFWEMAIESTPSSVRTNSPGSWHLFCRKLPAISTSLREATFVLGLLVLGIANCKLKDVLQRRPGNLGSIARRAARGFVRLAIGVAWDITAQCDSLTESNFDAAFVWIMYPSCGTLAT